MGSLIAKFRSKPSTIEILENIEKDITRLQKFRLRNQQQQKKFIGSLILYSIILYIIAALILYFVYLPPDWKNRLLFSSPLLVFPVLIWLIKKFLHWYFVKRITQNDLALNELREKRKVILEEVMEKETYKKAREILQKFDPAKFKELEPPTPTTPKVTSPGSALRYRGNASGNVSPPGASTPYIQMRGATPGMRPGVRPGMSSPRPIGTPHTPRSGGGMQPRMFMTPIPNGRTPGPPLPRPILPRERSTTDRLLEYLVGDGPQNRFALICRYCHSHNGMALKEEFEYLSFRCCYCYQMNLAKKQRPYAPKLDTVLATPVRPLQRPPGGAGVRGPNEEEGSEDDEEDDTGDESSEEANGDDVTTTSSSQHTTEANTQGSAVQAEVKGQVNVGGQEEVITSSTEDTEQDMDVDGGDTGEGVDGGESVPFIDGGLEETVTKVDSKDGTK